jgi:hypothetical protein
VLVVAAGVAVVWQLVRGTRTHGRVSFGAGVAVAFCLVLTVVQHAAYPDVPSPDRNLPETAPAFRQQLTRAQGDVMLVGDVASLLKADPSVTSDFLTGSAWYLNPHPVQNMYTTIGHRAYVARYSLEYDGSTAPELLDTLISREPTTGALRLDLLGISTLLLVRADVPTERLDAPPPGWRLAASTPLAVTWVRRDPVPGAGRPVWSSAGTSVSLVSASDRTARFRVDEVPSDGGQVVLSTLAWPGYRTDVGRLGDPVDGYLLNVRLPPNATGQVVTVHFSPPGWPLEVAAWWLGVLGGLAWSTLMLTRRVWRPAIR